MTRIIIPFLILCLTNSCATLLNSKTKRIDIITNTPAKVTLNNQTLENVNNRTKFIALRDIRPIKFSVYNDSVIKNITLDSKSSFAYWMNIYPSLGLGMLVDKDKPKRYTYPSRVYVDMTNNDSKLTTYYPFYRKGSIVLHVSLPHINGFLLKPIGEDSAMKSLGFWGIKLGINYYHNKNQFLDLSVSAVSDFFAPFPGAIDIWGEYDLMTSIYSSFSNNHRIGRFSLGYGLSFSKNTWDHRYYDRFDAPPPLREPFKKSEYILGFIFPIYHQFGEYFYMGLIYRPTFLKVHPETQLIYEHLISIDFAWKFNLTK
jgi:hypothetical protein